MRGVNDRSVKIPAETAKATRGHVHLSCGSVGKVLNRMKRKKSMRVAIAKVALVHRVEPTVA
jgi:hypothetical protein